MSRVLGVASNYPSRAEPGCMPQIRGLFESFAGLDVGAGLIVPHPWWRGPVEEIPSPVAVERPRFVPLSNQYLGPGISTFRLTVRSYRRAVIGAARSHASRPDAVLGYFAFPAGFAALALARRWRVPAVVSLGESSMRYYERHLGRRSLGRTLRSFSGIVCLCESRRVACVERYGVDEARVEVVPNAADPTLFRPKDRDEVRRAMGLSRDRPIVITVGWFGRRKGTNRVLRALRGMPDVDGVFLGEGEQVPKGPRVLHAASESPRGVADWLAASDLFVLPTRAEGGGPNAIVEAMATGLPLVVSDIPGMRQVVGEDAAVFLDDPDDEREIAVAIRRVLDSPDRARRMGRAALRRARAFTLEDRARRILAWMSELDPVDPPR